MCADARPFAPAEWRSRRHGKTYRYSNSVTGEDITRAEFEKRRAGGQSFKQLAAERRAENPYLSDFRPARGRKLPEWLKKENAERAKIKRRERDRAKAALKKSTKSALKTQSETIKRRKADPKKYTRLRVELPMPPDSTPREITEYLASLRNQKTLPKLATWFVIYGADDRYYQTEHLAYKFAGLSGKALEKEKSTRTHLLEKLVGERTSKYRPSNITSLTVVVYAYKNPS